MAKRRAAKPKKTKKNTRKKPTLKSQLIKVISGLGVILLLVVAAGWLTTHVIFRKSGQIPLSPFKTMVKPRAYSIPAYEVFPKKDLPVAKPVPIPPVSASKELPKVAIIIDDIGYDKKIADKFLRLDGVFTFSLLPYSPLQKKIADAAHARGFETMLHLPMEPVEYPDVDPGKGALLTSMSPDQLITQLEKNLSKVPYIKGVNNHMGSKITAVSTQMYQVFSILKKRNLFFIDSRTTVDTLCRPSARLLQVPFAQRDVFLDHSQDPDEIRRQIKRLIETAVKEGQAVGIGHPHDVTYQILNEMLTNLKRRVQLVPASKVVHFLG